jgi:hypothetical protein
MIITMALAALAATAILVVKARETARVPVRVRARRR